MARLHWLIPLLLVWSLVMPLHAQQDRAKLVQNDRAAFDQDNYWIYNDLDRGIAKAKETGRPLLIVFR